MKKSKIDLVLENQKKLAKNQEKIIKEEVEIRKVEESINIKEGLEEKRLKELEVLEENIKNNLDASIVRVTKRDIFKGFVGSTFGVLGHFAFYKGYEISKEIDLIQATILIVVAFALLNIILFYAGFKNIEKTYILKFMPKRCIILFVVSIFSIFLVNSLFGKLNIFEDSFIEIYKLISANILLAIIGAATADLIGKNE